MKSENLKYGKAGFTLIELMITIAIIGIIAVIAFGVVRSAQQRAVDANIQSTRSKLTTAIESYYALYSEYPENLEDMVDGEVVDKIPDLPSNCGFGVEDCGIKYERLDKQTYRMTVKYIIKETEEIVGGQQE